VPDNSPNPAVGAAIGVTDFVTDPVGALTGAGDGDGAGVGNLLTPRNIAIAVGIYLVVTRTGVGERVGDAVTGG